MTSTSPSHATRGLRVWLEQHWASLCLIGWAVGTYWVVQDRLPEWASGNPNLNYYVIQPVLWTGLAAGGWLARRRFETRHGLRTTLAGLALLTGGLQVALLIYGGYLNGFAESPIAGRLVNYPKNLLYITTLVAGIEVARAYLIGVVPHRRRRLMLGAIIIAGAIAYTPLAQIRLLFGGDLTFEITMSRLIPTIALSALLTWLTDRGGIGPSFAYALPVLGWEFFSPVYPANPWWFIAGIGLIVPLVAPWLIDHMYARTEESEALGRLLHPSEGRTSLAEEDEGRASDRLVQIVWSALGGATLAALLVVFVVLGVRPLVVSGISMEPAYERGDIALVRQVDADTLEVGDVIVFTLHSVTTIHRIVDIDRTDEGLVLTTQGDNVNRPDPPIRGDDVEGKVVFLLPEVGRAALWLRGA